MRTWFCLLLMAILLVPGCKKRASDKQPTIRVTAIPDENPTELQRKYAPLVDFLSRKLGVRVRYVPVTDYGAAVQALVANKIDFAWLGGFTHVQSRRMTKVVPVVMRRIDRTFKSVFIASSTSGVTEMAQIKGHTLAFGSKSSTSGHLMPRYFLLKRFKLDPDKHLKGRPLFSGAHDATVKLVESGKVDVGTLNKQVWDRMLREKRVDTSKVKLIWTTPGYVDYVWTARKAVKPELIQKFRRALLELNISNAADRRILKLQGARGFVNASPRDFDAIERVALKTGLLK